MGNKMLWDYYKSRGDSVEKDLFSLIHELIQEEQSARDEGFELMVEGVRKHSIDVAQNAIDQFILINMAKVAHKICEITMDTIKKQPNVRMGKYHVGDRTCVENCDADNCEN